jgi:hypothetical protein
VNLQNLQDLQRAAAERSGSWCQRRDCMRELLIFSIITTVAVAVIYITFASSG